MTTFKEAQDHYNDTEWDIGRGATTPHYYTCDDDTDYLSYRQRDARLTLLSYYIPLLALAAVALWLSVLPGVVSAAIIVGLLIVAVNNVAGALGDE